MLIFIIVVFTLVMAIGIPLAMYFVHLRDKAKREAQKIIETGQITDEYKFKAIIQTLSSSQDAESIDLVRRLNDIKYKTPLKS